MLSESQRNAYKKYMKKFYSRHVRFPIEDVDRIRNAAESIGSSFNGFIVSATMRKVEMIEREKSQEGK